MSGLLGQGQDFARALEEAGALRLPHALLVEGAPGTGTSSAAIEIAQALLCDPAAADGACRRRVASGMHPDLHFLGLDPDALTATGGAARAARGDEDPTSIAVDRVRALRDALARQPIEGRAIVAIVDPADRLNESGQNALLKTLEEPPAGRFLLLVTSRPEALFETVRSRCARLRIRPLPDEVLRTALDAPPSASPAEREAAVAMAGGSLGTARRLLEEHVRAMRTSIAAFLADPTPRAVHALKGLLAGAEGRTETERRMREIFLVTRGELRRLAAAGVAEGSAEGYGAPTAEPWISALEIVFDAEQDFASLIPARQVLDGMALGLVGALGGTRS